MRAPKAEYKTKINHLILFFFFLLFFSYYVSADSVSFQEAYKQYKYKNFERAKKELKNFDDYIANNPTVSNLILQGYSDYLKACIILEISNLEKDLSMAIRHIEDAIVKQPRNLFFREAYVKIISKTINDHDRLMDFFDKFHSSYEGIHWNKANLYKAIYQLQMGLKSLPQSRETFLKNALELSRLELNKNWPDILLSSFYLKVYISYFQNNEMALLDSDYYDLFINSLKLLPDDSSNDILYIKALSFKFLHIYS
jgi:hypothetical protein